MGHSGVADGVFLHGLQQGGLGLGRGAVQFVRQKQVGEDRAGLEPERPSAGAVVLLHHLGAKDVGGHQVGRELDPAELQRQGLSEGSDQQRLAQPRHALDQAVTARQEADQQLFDHSVLADHGLADGGLQL